MPRRLVTGLLTLLIIGLTVVTVEAQQTAFTYQGKLSDSGSPANGNYDLQFGLFDSASGGAQIGQTQTLNNVSASGGIFNVTLDFGANAFTGASRFIEISARPSGTGAFTLLTPRQPINATPYAVRSLNASTAEVATNAQQLGGVASGGYVKTDDGRLTDARSPTAGSASYIQNTLTQQISSNFNISGNGSVGGTLTGNIVNAGTQYNLKTRTVLSFTDDGFLHIGEGTRFGVAIGAAFDSGYQLEVVAQDNKGLRIGTLATGGKVLSVGGAGDVEVDSNGTAGGRFVIREDGNVGIGKSGPGAKLDVGGNIRFASLGTGGITQLCRNGGGEISQCSSSLRYKTDFHPFSSGLNLINRLHPLTFRWKADKTLDLGLGAEDVAAVEPLLTTRNANGEVEGVKYDRLTVVLINAVKEQQAQIERQQAEIAGLKKIVCSSRRHARVCK